MIATLKPYPAYKDSGVEWLGQVPEGWEISRADRHLRPSKRLLQPKDLIHNRILHFSIPAVQRSGRGIVEDGATIDSAKIHLATPVLLVSRLNPRMGTVTLAEPDPELLSVCSTEFVPMIPISCLGAYALYVYRSEVIRLELSSRVESATKSHQRVGPDDIYKLLIPFPPLPEQTAIVKYLNHVDRKVKRFIRVKRKLIALLEEQKRAIIHQAVTRGLDPNVPMKDSGIEWLGEVPEHWEVVRLGRMAKIFNGATPSRMEPGYWNAGSIPWLSSGKVNDYVVEAASELVTERALRECSISLVPKGAVIIGLVGQGKTRAKAAILAIEACINQNLAAVVPFKSLTSNYLLYFLTAFYRTFREFGRGGNQEALNCEIVSNWRTAVPSINEQNAICQHLETAFVEIRQVEKRINREIELLNEYRTRLISDVVTGKLDVREAAAGLPEEMEQEEPEEIETDEGGEVEEETDQLLEEDV